MNEAKMDGMQDFIDDHNEFNKEEIQMELDKIPEMEKKIDRLETELRIIHKRIARLQDQKKDG